MKEQFSAAYHAARGTLLSAPAEPATPAPGLPNLTGLGDWIKNNVYVIVVIVVGCFIAAAASKGNFTKALVTVGILVLAGALIFSPLLLGRIGEGVGSTIAPK